MNGSRRRYLAMRKHQRQGQLGKGYFRPLSPNETHLLQRDKWYFNWEELLTTPSTLHIYGLFANNHRLLSLMAVDLEPGVVTLEYAERAGYVEKRTNMYRTLPHMIGYDASLCTTDSH